MSRIRHVVLFQFYDVIDDDTRFEAVERLRALEELPGIVEWRLESSLDDRKGTVVMQNVLFESEQALDAYRSDPRHAEAASLLSAVANWLIADYVD